MFTRLGAVVLFTPVFLIPGVLMAVIGGYCGQVYMKSQLSVKREMSVARAPVLAHFGSAVAGLGELVSHTLQTIVLNQPIVSIRAYGAQSAFKEESLKRIDRYTRPARTFYNLNLYVIQERQHSSVYMDVTNTVPDG